MLFSLFANVRTRDDLLEFISNFGPLTRGGFAVGDGKHPEPVPKGATWGDDVSGFLKSAGLFRVLLSNKKRPRKLASVFDSQVRAGLLAADKEVAKTVGEISVPPRRNAQLGEFNRFVGTVDLVSDPVKGMRLRITTETFIGALWIQLGLKLSGAAVFRECRHCGGWFEAGAGTGRRADAEFCSNEHKIRFFSLNRTRRR